MILQRAIVIAATLAFASGALAQSNVPDPKMPPMPSMEGPEATGDMAKPPSAAKVAPPPVKPKGDTAAKPVANAGKDAKTPTGASRKEQKAKGVSKKSAAKPAKARGRAAAHAGKTPSKRASTPKAVGSRKKGRR